MSYTQTDLANIRKAIASGAKKVRFGSGESAHETEFRSLAEMRQVEATIVAELEATKPFSPVTYVEHTRD